MLGADLNVIRVINGCAGWGNARLRDRLMKGLVSQPRAQDKKILGLIKARHCRRSDKLDDWEAQVCFQAGSRRSLARHEARIGGWLKGCGG